MFMRFLIGLLFGLLLGVLLAAVLAAQTTPQRRGQVEVFGLDERRRRPPVPTP
jgi:hypothetical protein